MTRTSGSIPSFLASDAERSAPATGRHAAGADRHASGKDARHGAPKAAARREAAAHARRHGTAPEQPVEPHAPAAPRRRGAYIPALDGIRALAVAGVILYHLNLPWAQGGMNGVTVFFVLSGFLITRLLIEEIGRTRTVDLKGFWIRRLRRLMPAMIAVVAVTAALCTLFNHVLLTKMRPDIVPSLLLFSNWWQVLQNLSYFEAVGDPSPLTHFWSLAVEGQFYLVWPLLLMAAHRLGVSRRAMGRVTLALAVASAAAMALLYDPGADPTRLYYGTDTRAFSLLLGAWLAFIPTRRLTARGLSAWARRMGARLGIGRGGADVEATGAVVAERAECAHDTQVGAGPQGGRLAEPRGHAASASASAGAFPAGSRALNAIGLIGLAGVLALMALTNGYTAFQYRGGMLLATVLTMMLMAACCSANTLVARLFSLKPLVWLGQRSYGIYLWHFPLLLLMNPSTNVSSAPWWLTLVHLGVVVAAAELSYRFIETPFRHGALGRLAGAVRAGDFKPGPWARRHVLTLAASAAVLAVAAAGVAAVPDTSAMSDEGAALLQGSGQQGGSGAEAKAQEAGKGSADDTSPKDGFPDSAYDVLMIGDSVSLRTVPVFEQTFPHGHIDAAVSRQFGAGIDIYNSYVQQNQAGKVAVFALGTNGVVTADQIDALMNVVGEKRVAVFVNTRSPRDWVPTTNQAIADAATRYKNVRVADWYGYSEGRDDLFDGDGTHLTEQGAQEYIGLVRKTIGGALPFHASDYPDGNFPQDDAVKKLLDDAAKALGRPKPKPLKAS